MKQITVDIFSFSELQPDVKKRVLEKHRYVEVDDTNWYRFELMAFTELCSLLGILTSPEQIFFSGFYHQGAGSTFRCTINVLEMVKAVSQKVWEKEDFRKIHFTACPCQPRILQQIEKGNIDCRFFTCIPNRGYYIDLHEDHRFHLLSNGSNIERELLILFDWIKRNINELNTHLYQSLQSIYEGLTSDEAVADFLEANEWAFTCDGRLANHLV
ncbi:hypothetical protein [Pedobacter frigoris]|uniref:hypothetical protein n=1 Tax=Pedobacter frigoris TaxID=2571272 RepID=UPI002931BACA|nr:hypothetical protein [Pedobacter frigoris]